MMCDWLWREKRGGEVSNNGTSVYQLVNSQKLRTSRHQGKTTNTTQRRTVLLGSTGIDTKRINLKRQFLLTLMILGGQLKSQDV
jgi:hypothetical protein